MKLTKLFALLLIVASLAGCKKSETAAAAPSLEAWQPTEAQPKLSTMKIYLGTETLDAEIALTQKEEMTGMMFRTHIQDTDAMLFVFPFPQRAVFWMKNCPESISAAYISPDGVIQEIHHLEKEDTNSVLSATENIGYVLETSDGWFSRHNVNTGAVVRTEHGSLAETFSTEIIFVHAKSEKLFAEALRYIPGGVNSPVRAFRAVGGQPFFVNSARGARIWDVDGNELIDYVGTWGPAILGHAHPKIISAIKAAAEHGTSFGIPNPLEVKMAKLICEFVPGIQKVRMCNSGTEACMSAIRLARGFTKRDQIIKFDGCYHGHADSLLVKAGSGALTFGNPDSAGVPAAFTQHTIVAPFNDVDAVKEIFAANKNQIAGIIIEPVPGNAGLYLPKPGYLEFLREITKVNGALLIFDEVMTGFRLAPGGAQERFGISPDLTCLGKIIGGGLPVGALGGRAEIMDLLAPLGPVYQAGTLSGNPLAMAAGIAALEELQVTDAYGRLEKLGEQFEAGMKDAAKCTSVPVRFNFCGSMFCAYFTGKPVHNLADALKSDRERFAGFFHGMLAEGFYFAPSQFEAGFISTAHTAADIEQTVKVAAKILRAL